MKLPNLTHPLTPIGNTSKVLYQIHDKQDYRFPLKDCITLGDFHGLIDIEAGSLVSGRKFYYLAGEAVLLELALIQYTMEKLINKGYTPYIPPDVIKNKYMLGCGFQPRDTQQSQSFEIKNNNNDVHHKLLLSGTAELQMAGYFAEQIFQADELPIKTVSFAHAFRTESGQTGKSSSGIYRVNQFSKVELFSICTKEQSEQMLNEIVDIQIEIIEELGLHAQVLDMPIEDLGASAYRKIDIEAYMPGRINDNNQQGMYGEISSASNCTDYQSRRLNMRYKDKKYKHYCHTLNGTALAVPRIITAIFEQFQKADLSIEIPAVLRKYMMNIETIPNHNLAFRNNNQ